MSERAATRAVDLRHAAQAVRVLDLPAVPVRLQDLAVDQEHPDILGHHLLAGVWPHGLNALVEWSDASLQRLEAHCGQDRKSTRLNQSRENLVCRLLLEKNNQAEHLVI